MAEKNEEKEKKELTDLEKRMATEQRAANLEGQMKREKEEAAQRKKALKEALAMRGEGGGSGGANQPQTAVTSNLTVPVSVEPVRMRMAPVDGGQPGQPGQPTGQPTGTCSPCNDTQTISGLSTPVVIAIMAVVLLALIALLWFFASSKPVVVPSPIPQEQKQEEIYHFEDGLLKPLSYIFDLLSTDAYAEKKKVEVDVIPVVKKDVDKINAEILTKQKLIEQLGQEKIGLTQKVIDLTSAVEKAQKESNKQVGRLISELNKAKVELSEKERLIAAKKEEIERLNNEKKALVEQNHTLEIDKAKDTGKTERVKLVTEKAYSLTPDQVKSFQGVLPGEEKSVVVRKIPDGLKCPEGQEMKFYNIGSNTSFTCQIPLEEPPALGSTSKYVKCLAWAGVGGAIGGGVSFGYARHEKNEFGLWDALGTTAASGGVSYGICLLLSK